uniref:Middle T antigen n=1 Tax=Rattus norvegicus polyomavirus 1 TaxID=1679933 RepID=A0A0H4Q2M6_9POLY|nr:middle T antigen [Rattus norvegicus polyomavirus 1]
MDKILTKEEKSQLLALLDLDGQYWGDFGRMQKAYHAQSLKFHPDKGGDPLLMQLLNTLWTKLKHGLHQVRLNLGGHEVRRLPEGDWWLSTRQTFGGNYSRRLCRMPITCLQNKACSTCNCILCTLRRQHRGLKKACLAPCLVLGECYCLDCFSLWFGLPINNFIVVLYAEFLGDIPVDWLDIDVHQIYNPAVGKMLIPLPADSLLSSSTIPRLDTTGHSPTGQQASVKIRRSGGRSFSRSGRETSIAVRSWDHHPRMIPLPPPPLFLYPLAHQDLQEHPPDPGPVPPSSPHHQAESVYMQMDRSTMEESSYAEINHQHQEEPIYQEMEGEEPIYQNLISPIYLQILPEAPSPPLVRITTPQRNWRLMPVRETSSHPRPPQRNRLLIGILLMICLLCLGALCLMLYTLIRHKIVS